MRKPGTTKKGEKPRANGVRSLSDLLGTAGGPSFRRFGFVQHSIVSRWAEIVGERYAAVSSPESIRFPTGKKSDGVLSLLVQGAHAPMMQHVVPTLIERVNMFFGYPAIARVSIRQGRVAPPSLRPVAPQVPSPVPAELGESLREVSDPELHAVLESLARGLANDEDTVVVTAIPLVGRIGERRK